MNKTFKIKWIHCISCEILIEQELKNVKWIKFISVDYKKRELKIEFLKNEKNNEKNNEKYLISEIEKILEKNNFSIEKEKIFSKKENFSQSCIISNEKNNFKDFLEIFWILFIFWILIFFLKDLEIVNKFSSFSWDWIFVSFLLWIIASLSTCLALTWWIVISLWKKISSQVLFHTWRILWFFLLGWILWYVWKSFTVSLWISSFLSILVWFVLFVIWLWVLKFLPNISNFWFHLPKFLSKWVLSLQWEKWKSAIFLLWILTFFLPCGFTQAVQLSAINSWSFFSWALITWAFALWTLPVLWFVWFSVSFIQWKDFSFLKKVIWVLIVIFWLFSVNNWIHLSGFSVSSLSSLFSWNQNIEQNFQFELWESSFSENVEVVEIKHNWITFEKQDVYLKSWKKYRLEITPSSNWLWCMTAIALPRIDWDFKQVKVWEKIIYNVWPLKPGSYPAVCWMWMLHWTFIVQ